jgi:arsenate reductase (thioredoxin)
VSSERPEILFLCVHNAGRSQMAAAFARRIGGSHVTVNSAGSAPGETLNVAVVEAMLESEEMGRSADVIITMGCGDACPFYPGKTYVDWELTDPAGKGIEDVRLIRDDIELRVRELVDGLLEN